MTKPRCEDAPCCGCCGTNIYGVDQEDGGGPPFCDICTSYHGGPCPEDDYDPDDEDGWALGADR
jgi:hypothetical protein